MSRPDPDVAPSGPGADGRRSLPVADGRRPAHGGHRGGLPQTPRARPYPLIRSVEPLSAGRTHRDSRLEVNRLAVELLERDEDRSR